MGTTTVESTSTSKVDLSINEAIGFVEENVATFADRELVGSQEVVDLLLDVRAMFLGIKAVEAAGQVI